MLKYMVLLFAVLAAPVYAARPSATVTDVINPSEDTYIHQDNPTSSYGNNGNVMFGYQSGKTIRGLFKFTIPAHTSIVSGSIQFANVSGGSFSNWTGRADLRALGNATWTETSTWNNVGGTTWPSTSAGTATSDGVITLSDFSGHYALGFKSGFTGNMNVRSSEVTDPHPPRLTLTYTRSACAGDANLDGIFNSTDLVLVFQAGKYETGIQNADWATGDWNEDGYFNSSDLVLAFQEGCYTEGDMMAKWEELNE